MIPALKGRAKFKSPLRGEDQEAVRLSHKLPFLGRCLMDRIRLALLSLLVVVGLGTPAVHGQAKTSAAIHDPGAAEVGFRHRRREQASRQEDSGGSK